MTGLSRKRFAAGTVALAAMLGLAACDQPPRAHVKTGVYYDSMVWRDYYWPRPPEVIPPEPILPIEPPIIDPPIVEPPIYIPEPPIPEHF